MSPCRGNAVENIDFLEVTYRYFVTGTFARIVCGPTLHQMESNYNLMGNITNLLIEIFVFVTIEIVTRHLHTSTHNSNKYAKSSSALVPLLTTEAVILGACIVILYVHHIAYLLIAITCGVVLRLVISWKAKSKTNQIVSAPINLAKPRNDQSVPVTQDTPRYTFNPEQLAHQKVDHTISLSDKPLKHSSHIYSKNTVLHNDKEPVKVRRNPTSTSFQSSLIRSSMPTSKSITYQNVPSLPKKQSTFGYIGAMFNLRPRPNTTPTGLINSGNTCFINSILQCLTWTPGFLDRLLSINSVNANEFEFLSTLCTVLNGCHTLPDGISRYESVPTSNLLTMLSELAPHLVTRGGLLSHQSQQDSTEFLLWLLNHMHTSLSTRRSQTQANAFDSNCEGSLAASKKAFQFELNSMKSSDTAFQNKLLDYSNIDWKLHRARDDSIVYDQFLGQLLEARECQICQKVSLNIEYFMMLPLPLPTTEQTNRVFSIGNCFDLFSRIEDLVQSNMIACSCLVPNEETLTPGKRRSLISQHPKTLIVQLTRYSYDAKIQTAVKNKVCVEFQTSMTLPCTLESELLGQECDTDSKIVYHLTGICAHSGADNTSSGHYVAYCKAGETWYYFNDENVEIVVDIEDEIHQYFILQNSYLLFYSLCSS